MRRTLKWLGIGLGVLALILATTNVVLRLIGHARLSARSDVAVPTLSPDVVAKASATMGEKIAITRGCTDCHADGTRGKVFLDIPPGFIVAPNLTKGRGGVGTRYATADDWNRAIRFGIRPDSTTITTFMPWWFFNRLSDADVAAVGAYLASAPPVDNELPPTKLRHVGYVMHGSPSGKPGNATRGAAPAAVGSTAGTHRGVRPLHRVHRVRWLPWRKHARWQAP